MGEQARKVLADGRPCSKKIIEGRWLTANAVVGLYPANRVGDDDIAFWADETRQTPVLTWYGLRQQTPKETDGTAACAQPLPGGFRGAAGCWPIWYS